MGYSGAGVPLWTNRFNLRGNGDARASGVAVDSSGNVYVTGYSTATNHFRHYATVAYSGAGVPLWTNGYTGPSNVSDAATAIAVDSSGNVFVTGYSYEVFGVGYATVAYSGAGVPLWTNEYKGPGNGGDYASAMTVDSGGNVLVTGYSTDTAGYYDYATIKYSSSVAPPARLDFKR